MTCPICNSSTIRTEYDGPIRAGGAGEAKYTEATVLFCETCRTGFLASLPQDDRSYQEKSYWESRKLGERKNALQKLGAEQTRWLDAIGLEVFAEAVVAEFGAGHGLFLDLVQQAAVSTMAVEPATFLRQELEARGHTAYAAVEDMPDAAADVLVSFDTLEHVRDPMAIVGQLQRVLRPGGQCIIGVPNFDDFLKAICPAYLSFFYHASHLYYFSLQSLQHMLQQHGFKLHAHVFVHKYNMSNMVNWLRESRPTGNPPGGVFDRCSEETFRSNVERQGRASHVLLRAEKAT